MWQAVRWLADAARDAAVGSGGVPHWLRWTSEPAVHPSGLRPLQLGGADGAARPWLHRSPTRAARELRMKRELLLGSARDVVHRCEPGPAVLRAAQETLRLVAEHVTHEWPQAVRLQGIDWRAGVGTIVVAPAGADDDEHRYEIGDFWAHAPLVLASLLVQEDLILLRPSGGDGADAAVLGMGGSGGGTGSGAAIRHVFAAGCACFSFTELGLDGERGNMKTGHGLAQIHAAVPGFHEHLAARMDSTLSRLKPGGIEEGLGRSNWGIAPHADMSPLLAPVKFLTATPAVTSSCVCL